MPTARERYIAKYGDPMADAPPDTPEDAPSEDSGLSDEAAKRLQTRVLIRKWREKKGKEPELGEKSFIDSVVQSGNTNFGPEDLRQRRDLIAFLADVDPSEIDKSLTESGQYTLGPSAPGAADPKSLIGDIARAGWGEIKKAAKPFTELASGHPLNALKEAALLPATMTEFPRQLVGQALNTGKEAVIGGALDLSPKTAVKAGWKALTEGGEEQQQRLDASMTSLGVNPSAPVLGRMSRITGFFADPLNLPAGAILGKFGRLAGIRGVSKLGIDSKLAEDAGNALAKVVGTEEEKWGAQLGKQAGADVMEEVVQAQVKKALAKKDWKIKVEEAFTNPEVTRFLKKVPFIGESGAAKISSLLTSLPKIGKKFGVDEAEQQAVYRVIEDTKGLDANGDIMWGAETRTGSGVPNRSTFSWGHRPSSMAQYGSPATGAEAFDSLSPAGQRAVKWWVNEREMNKAAHGIESDIEGYIHHYEDPPGLLSSKKEWQLAKQKASATMYRSGGMLNPVEHAKNAILKGESEVIDAELHNQMLNNVAPHVAEPIPANGVIPEGYVQVPKLRATRTGGAIPQMTGGKMMRKDVYDRLVLYGESAKSVSRVSQALRSTGNFFKSNLLLAPGTAVTNAISGGFQTAGKIIEDMAKVVLKGEFKPVYHDLESLLGALRPKNMEGVPSELWGGKSALFSDIGRSTNPFMKAMRAGLAPFQMIENYWKRVLAMTELKKAGAMGMSPNLIAHNKTLINDIGKTVDKYAFNYDNVPQFLKNLRESSWGWAILPFPTYAYKLSRMYSRYGAALNPFILMEPADRLARVLTMTTLGGMGYHYAAGEDRKHIQGMTSQADTTGRTMIGTTPEGKEKWLRTVKYPWMNAGQAMKAGADLLSTGDDEGLQNVAGEFMSEGPLIEGLKIAANVGNRWEAQIPRGQRLGNIAAGFIPGTRLTQGVKAMKGGPRVLPETFWDAVKNATPLTGMSGKIQTDRITHKPVVLDPSIETMKFWLGLSMKEIEPRRYTVEKQRLLHSALVSIQNATDSLKLNDAVDKLARIDSARLDKIAEAVKKKRLFLDGEGMQESMQAMLERSVKAKLEATR